MNPQNNQKDVTDLLRDAIIAGEFAAGAPLRIDALATRYGLSHMPIREALRRLEGEGLLTLTPNRGARVIAVDAQFVADLMELRTVIESHLARKAAQRMTSAELAEIAHIQTRYESAVAAGDAPSAVAINQVFHTAINDVAANRDANFVLDRHWRLIRALWRHYGYASERFATVIVDHQNILSALAAQDPEAAAAYSAAHSMRAKQQLLKQMQASPRHNPPSDNNA